MENQHDELIQKLLNRESLSESEIQDLVYEYDDYIFEQEKGENRRWSRGVMTVFKVDDRYFMVNWDEGLTEYQENEFYDQPYEVTLKVEEQIIKVNTYSKVV
jgi:hypothetical protein